MSIIKLDVQASTFHFHLVFEQRLNLIVGDSGSGKTTLYNYISQSRTNQDIQVHANYPVLLATIDSYALLLRSAQDAIILFDDFDVMDTDDFFGLVQTYCVPSNLWLIVMSREDDEPIRQGEKRSLSTNSVYQLRSEHGNYVNIPYDTRM